MRDRLRSNACSMSSYTITRGNYYKHATVQADDQADRQADITIIQVIPIYTVSLQTELCLLHTM